MQYRLNHGLDIEAWTPEYAKDMRCRVTNILDPESARTMTRTILENAEFKQAHISENQYREISKEEFSKLDIAKRQALVREVYTLAREGIGFWYGRQGLNKGITGPLEEIRQWLGSEETLDAVRKVTGIASLTPPSAQITSFAPGDFLTRHKDDVTAEKRKVAFVLNLTENWHPDWGGLLQFFRDSGETRDSWSPVFNSLCLFDVKHVHSVTCIAPFSPKVRLAISGWFHEKI